MHRGFGGFSAALGLCAVLACEVGDDGGGDGGTGTGPPETTVNFLSTAQLDGWVRSDGVANAASLGFTGDLDAVLPGVGVRQFYSFQITAIPAGVTVTSATLRLYQASVEGSPYTDLGSVIVDHLDYGGSLEGADYDAVALASNIGTISTDATVGYKTLVVTVRVEADLAAGRTRSQFRIRFSNVDSNNDGGNDFAQFTDAEFGTNVPVLEVKYR